MPPVPIRRDPLDIAGKIGPDSSMPHRPEHSWIVHKFGGTSVANAERYRRVAGILREEDASRKGIVVSAMAGVTDQLIGLLNLARARDPSHAERLEEIRERHRQTVHELLPEAEQREFLGHLDQDLSMIRDLLRAIWLSRTYAEQSLELISGFGELWSARILDAHLRATGIASRWLDAREVLVVRPGETGPAVDWEISQRRMNEWLAANPEPWLVITGYIASTAEGIATTLRRNGSDFSASIFGALLDAGSITIWTDVDGVLSADPRKVPEAVVLDEMSYQEAVELAYFGAKVLHPHTMAPALRKGIPIWIRNTFNPGCRGTRIHHPESPSPEGEGVAAVPVKGFSTMDRISLVNVEGTGMIGVPGIAHRLFGALREVGVSVIMISQASSEHSICLAVPEPQGALARETVEKVFYPEIQQGRIESVTLLPGCSILAAVGDRMVRAPGVAAKLFQALGKAGINIRAIAQGSSERNISVVIDQADATRALRTVHAGFYLSAQTISLGLLGPGLIGSALLRQLHAQLPRLRSQLRIDLRIRGIANSRGMLLSDPGIRLDEWAGASFQAVSARLKSEGAVTDLDAFTRHIHAEHLPHSVIIDCTSSEQVAGLYETWLERGIHVITPNKKANSGPLREYLRLRMLGRKLGSHYLYEATVGAGLPVITTLRDLLQTGDRVHRIEGILSGTLSYLFNSLSEGRSFSSIVREARTLGYTEPDPREDLSGRDVARKLIILGREMGLNLEMEQIQTRSLVPARLRAPGLEAEAFLDSLEAHDAEMATLWRAAAEKGEVLRYVGIVCSDGASSVELRSYPKTHPFARVEATDNIIAFTTSRYLRQPLIVQGPGAGPDVTAGGIFADLLRLATYLGAPS